MLELLLFNFNKGVPLVCFFIISFSIFKILNERERFFFVFKTDRILYGKSKQ